MNIDEAEVRQRLSQWTNRLEATGLAERRKKKATAIALIVIDVLRETEEALSPDLLVRRVQDRMPVRAAEDGVRSVIDALATQPNSAVRYESGTLRWDPDGSVPALPVRPTDTLLSTRTAAAILEFASVRPGIELSVDDLQVGIGDLLGRRLSESGVRRAAETIANSKDFDFIQLSANGFVWEPRLQRSADVSTDSTRPGRLIAGLLNFAAERGSMGFRVAEAVDSFAAKQEAGVDESAVRRLLKALGRRKDIPLAQVERDRYLVTGRGTSDHSVELQRSTSAREISVPAHVVEMIE
ncbi:MAG TPA: hypothetical protein VN108_08185, partial [Marmoricola sp.]|nr:hypothetical protein [Marmoricola sp.]